MMPDVNLLVAAAAALCVWFLLRFGRPLVEWARSGKGDRPTDDTAGPDALTAAAHFYELRRHFARTDQPGRVAMMDEHLACGVFACVGSPAADLETITLRVTEGVSEVEAD